MKSENWGGGVIREALEMYLDKGSLIEHVLETSNRTIHLFKKTDQPSALITAGIVLLQNRVLSTLSQS